MRCGAFKVLSYPEKRSEKSGRTPVMDRITAGGTIAQFSRNRSVRFSLWNVEANEIAGKNLEGR